MIRINHDNETGKGDLVLGDFGLVSDDGLETAVYISLYSDARAEPTDGSDDPRGWWAETYGYGLGSKLWTLDRAKTTLETLRKAEGFATESLHWMIREGVASRIVVTASRGGQNELRLKVNITKPDGTQWSSYWTEQGQSAGYGRLDYYVR